MGQSCLNSIAASLAFARSLKRDDLQMRNRNAGVLYCPQEDSMCLGIHITGEGQGGTELTCSDKITKIK